MQQLAKDHFLQAEMMMVVGMLDHIKENFDDTVFEDDDHLENLLNTIYQGCEIVITRMKQNIKDDNEECICRDCC